MDYGIVRKTLKSDKLPLLYEMLNDKKYVDSWSIIAQIIGYVSKDPNSIPILLEYFQRDDSWSWESINLNNNNNSGFNKNYAKKRARIAGKISTLGWMGIIGGEKANNILREAVTQEGAEKLAIAWIKKILIPDSSTFKSKSETINYIRQRAIIGLMYSQDSENISTIRKLYEIEEAKCREKRKNNIFRNTFKFS